MSELTLMGVPATRRNLRNLAYSVVGCAWPPNTAVLARNALAVSRSTPWLDFVALSRQRGESLATLAARSLGWICRSQDAVGSGGVGDLEFAGWTPGYPEVTGYIIPTMWDYFASTGNEELGERAIRMTDWELRVQKLDGGVESLYEGERQPAVAFNTGQVIRGVLRSWRETGEQRYLDAAVRAGDWMVAKQDPDGSWTKNNYLCLKTTYDTFAAAGLAGLTPATGDERYARAALANCEFSLSHQLDNGWFRLCANTRGGGETPITHTLAYAADGLIEVGLLLGERQLVEAGERTARAMARTVRSGGWLPGSFDSRWRPRSRYVVVTGSAQLGILLAGIHRRHGDPGALGTAHELLDFLAWVARLDAVGIRRRGALPGSFPIWGRYVPLKFPSWPTKFMLDLIAHLRADGSA